MYNFKKLEKALSDDRLEVVREPFKNIFSMQSFQTLEVLPG